MDYQWTSSYSLRTELSFSAKYDRDLVVKPSKACVDHLSHGRMLIVLEPAASNGIYHTYTVILCVAAVYATAKYLTQH